MRDHIMEISRICLLDTASPVNLNLSERFTFYHPECLINWREKIIGGRRLLTLAVLETEAERADPEGSIKTKHIKQWRVLRLENGLYIQDLYEEDGFGNPEAVEKDVIPILQGKPFNEIPIFFAMKPVGQRFELKSNVSFIRET